MFQFGSGVLFGKRTDIANATPINFGLVQSVTLDISFDVKELYGQYQFPVAIGRGKGKFTGKAKTARISGIAWGNLFFGQAPVVGQLATAFGEAAAIPGTPFQITVANAATFESDFGVLYADTGLPLTRVAASPAAGQYSVDESTGIYTFNTADTAANVLINYTYTIAATGEQVKVTNQLLGTTPTFSAELYGTDPTTGKALNVRLHNCVCSKLSAATQLDDFMMPEFDFDIFANAAGDVMNVSLGSAD